MISPITLKAVAQLREVLEANGGAIQIVAIHATGAALCRLTGDHCDEEYLLVDPFQMPHDQELLN